MIERRITVNPPIDLMPILAGKVFHVTPTENMTEIKATGAIEPNQKSDRISLFGNSINGYFRLRGSVSFFDYRAYGSEEWKAHAYKCTPSQILHRVDAISILVLAEDQHKMLESWKNWKIEEKWSQRVVPVVEAGFPGPVDLKHITEHLLVDKSRS